VSTATASFTTTVRQMTKMFQWPICPAKNDRNVSAKKKHSFCNRWWDFSFRVLQFWGNWNTFSQQYFQVHSVLE